MLNFQRTAIAEYRLCWIQSNTLWIYQPDMWKWLANYHDWPWRNNISYRFRNIRLFFFISEHYLAHIHFPEYSRFMVCFKFKPCLRVFLFHAIINVYFIQLRCLFYTNHVSVSKLIVENNSHVTFQVLSSGLSLMLVQQMFLSVKLDLFDLKKKKKFRFSR